MPRKHDRCSGHCCEKFTIPLSPEDLAKAYRRWLGRDSEDLQKGPAGKVSPIYQDIHLIAPMVSYIGYTDDHPPQVNPSDSHLQGKPKEKLHYYSCKHLDPITRDCTIYEIRPAMCRSYPNSGLCNYAKCTWKSHKAKRETPAERNRRRKRLTANVEELQLKEPKK